ncbi:MAG: M23 family metallopeptidase [Bacilli bacterium]
MAENKFRVRPGVNNNSKNRLLYNPNERKRRQLGRFSGVKNSENENDEIENEEIENENIEDELTKNNSSNEENEENNYNESASANNVKEEVKEKAKEIAKEQVKEIAKKKVVAFIVANPWVLAVIAGVILIFIVIISLAGGGTSGGNLADYELSSGEKYWWPVGGSIEENGKAIGTPSTINISSPFGNRKDPFNPEQYKFHSGVDIASPNEHFIIAAKTGKIITATTGCIEGNLSCGGGYGNHVIIEHIDGIKTTYAHLKEDSIRVSVGDEVSQGQIIGNMGSTGSSTGRHLHFGVMVNNIYVNPLDYISIETPRPDVIISSLGTTSLLKTSLTKNEFVSYLNNYSKKIEGDRKTNFDNNFLPNAELIYNVSISNGINPETVLMWAMIESGYKKCGGSYNFWGIGIPNGKGCSAGPQYATMEDGLNGFAKVITGYQDKNGSSYKSIMTRYEERKNAGCRPGGYGTPDTLEGVLSIYAWFGTYLANPGSSGDGGCYYIKYWADNSFFPETYNKNYLDKRCNANYKCESASGGGSCVETTICEQSDYTIYSAQERLKARKMIFNK